MTQAVKRLKATAAKPKDKDEAELDAAVAKLAKIRDKQWALLDARIAKFKAEYTNDRLETGMMDSLDGEPGDIKRALKDWTETMNHLVDEHLPEAMESWL